MTVDRPAPFSDKLEKYNSNGNEITVRLGDIGGWNRDREITLDTIFLKQSKRRHGTGSEIVKNIIKLGKEYGFERLWVYANPAVRNEERPSMDRDELVDWYEKLGFRIFDEKMIGTIMVYDLQKK